MAHQGLAQPHDAALTPRPIRLLLIGSVEPGNEVAVRHAQAHFPTAAATAAGIDAVEAFVGSGYYALSLEIDEDDVQPVLAAYFNDPAVQAFHGELERVVKGLPSGTQQFSTGDAFHGGAADAGAGAVGHLSTADLPLAAGMYRWRVGSDPRSGGKS